jgi:hypothetical protein
MPRILQVKQAAPYNRRTVKFGQAVEKSKNVFYQNGRPVTRSKRPVKRLMVVDPPNPNALGLAGVPVASVNTRPEADQFTNSTNPQYDPSKHPGSVQRKDGTPQPPKGATSGHQKVIGYNNQQRTGGKTLRRR